jgi:hypothetical protein
MAPLWNAILLCSERSDPLVSLTLTCRGLRERIGNYLSDMVCESILIIP